MFLIIIINNYKLFLIIFINKELIKKHFNIDNKNNFFLKVYNILNYNNIKYILNIII